tara:strand:- start:228 stop:464 length:237 start_codon:yes stop_codon:yes gene_type:complete
MPQIGWFEILIIVAIAIIVIGPKDFPVMLKKMGSWIGTFKRYVSNVQSEISNFENNDIKEDVEKKTNQLNKDDENDRK